VLSHCTLAVRAPRDLSTGVAAEKSKATGTVQDACDDAIVAQKCLSDNFGK
jgi:hypothetical protein